MLSACRSVVQVLLAVVLLLPPDRVAWAHPELEVLEQAAAEEVAHHPETPEVWLRQGQVLQVAREWDAALAAFERAAEHGADPDTVAAARGRLFLAAGWPRRAKREFDRVLSRRPDAFAVLAERGRACLQLGRPNAAAADLGRAIARMTEPTPEHVMARRDALVAAGRRDAAVRALDQGIGRLGRIPALELAAVDLEAELGRWNEALRRLEGLLRQSPRNEAWTARRGDLLARAGRGEEARVAYAAALALIEARPAHRRGERTMALERQLRAALAPTRSQREENQ